MIFNSVVLDLLDTREKIDFLVMVYHYHHAFLLGESLYHDGLSMFSLWKIPISCRTNHYQFIHYRSLHKMLALLRTFYSSFFSSAPSFSSPSFFSRAAFFRKKLKLFLKLSFFLRLVVFDSFFSVFSSVSLESLSPFSFSPSSATSSFTSSSLISVFTTSPLVTSGLTSPFSTLATSPLPVTSATTASFAGASPFLGVLEMSTVLLLCLMPILEIYGKLDLL